MRLQFNSRLFHLLATMWLGFGGVACSYVNAVSQTNIPRQRHKIVRAHTSRFMVLGFNFDNDYPYPLINQLKSQCANGQVRGLLTKDITTLYFLMFFWSREQFAEGYCVADQSAKVASEERSESTNAMPLAQDNTERDDVPTEDVEILEP